MKRWSEIKSKGKEKPTREWLHVCAHGVGIEPCPNCSDTHVIKNPAWKGKEKK